MARGSNVGVAVRYGDLPLLKQAEALAEQSLVTGASMGHPCLPTQRMRYARRETLRIGGAEFERVA